MTRTLSTTPLRGLGCRQFFLDDLDELAARDRLVQEGVQLDPVFKRRRITGELVPRRRRHAREHDDGHAAHRWILANPAAEDEAGIVVLHHEVEHDDIGTLLADLFQGAFYAVNGDDLVATSAEKCSLGS